MEITVDGIRLFCLPVGPEANYPLIVLHGGPGLDHTEMHPWLDPLTDVFRLIYVDLRGQGRSERVDPSTLTLERYAADITALAQALNLKAYAVLGHSYGSFVALTHAIGHGDATHYIISGGSASMSKSMQEVRDNLARFEPESLREAVTASWAREASATTPDEVAEIMRMQMPFHFAGIESDAYSRYMAAADRAIYAPEVLAYAASHEYALEYEDKLGDVTRPTLVITGKHDRTCTPRAARDMHRGIAGSELVIVPDAGHMSFIEQPEIYFNAVRNFFAGRP
jgi:proline iminopeptidase